VANQLAALSVAMGLRQPDLLGIPTALRTVWWARLLLSTHWTPLMSRANHAEALTPASPEVPSGLQAGYQAGNPHLSCAQCEYPIECVEQNRRSGTWLGSFICPNCRSEYFYAYRWGRLMRKT
jgi:hypothetical protein